MLGFTGDCESLPVCNENTKNCRAGTRPKFTWQGGVSGPGLRITGLKTQAFSYCGLRCSADRLTHFVMCEATL